MHYYEVAPNQIVRQGQTSLTYSSVKPLILGQVVRIHVGKKQLIGVVVAAVKKPAYEVKEIQQIIENTPLPAAYLKLASWMSEYYASPFATVLQTMLPRGLEKSRRMRTYQDKSFVRKRTNIVLNEDQSRSVTSVIESAPGTFLLHGITGSGKTAVYIELAKQTLKTGRSAIILVPEISLTSQLVDEFSHHFSDIILTHSRQTEAERHLAWREALNSEHPRVVIGPRSALFIPLSDIGLIVVDESHEPSYKQEQSPRYDAARVAHTLAAETDAKVVLGSATPPIIDYYLAQQKNRPILSLPKPANTNAVKPSLELVDMTKRSNFRRHRFFSNQLLGRLESDLSEGKQSLVFHNRRGSTSVTLCENCGWQAGCPRCFIPLTLHADIHELRCHICGLKSQVPTSCPECSNANIIHRGIGTKLIESELKKLFPKTNIARFDGDSSLDDTVNARYEDLYNGEIQIIIGTQVIAKGLDLPNLRSVGIVQADAGLSLPDFSATERTFQLLAQAIGRVGRSEHTTNVIVQSYQPTHPVIQYGLAQNYAEFYDNALQQRKRSNFPPYCYLLKLVCSYKTEAVAIRNSKEFAQKLSRVLPTGVEILGPTPAFYERSRDTYRWQLVIKSPRREHLLTAVKHLPPTHWQFVLDPISLL